MRKLIVAAVAALAVAAMGGAARAENWPDSRLDAIATAAAGKPVNVWCEDQWGDWIHTGDYFGEDWSFLGGFTQLSRPTVYINPSLCETLHANLSFGSEAVGVYDMSLALLVLLHESVHQRGVTDEAQAECTALPMVSQYAVSSLGWRQTETQLYTYSAKVRRKVNGRWVTLTVQRVGQRQVPSSRLAELQAMAVRWHRAAPAQYQGAC